MDRGGECRHPQQTSLRLTRECINRTFDIGRIADLGEDRPNSERGCDLLEGTQKLVGKAILRIADERNPLGAWCELLEQFKPLPNDVVFDRSKSSHIAAWLREAGYQTAADRISNVRKYDWDRPGLALEGLHGRRDAREDEIRRRCDELHRMNLHKLGIPARPAIIKPNVATFLPPKLCQSLTEGREAGSRFWIVFHRWRDDSNSTDSIILLRACREWPRRRHAAEERDELAALHRCNHSITSSARPMSGSGIVRPRTLAVIRLMISSTFTACWTGWLVALEDAANIDATQAIGIDIARAVAHQPPGVGEFARGVDRG